MGRVSAGSLNKRVTFQRKVLAQDAWGQDSGAWQDYVTVHADIRYQTGLAAVRNEVHSGGKEQSRASGSARIRKRADIDANMRMIYRGGIFDIAAVLPDETDDEYLDIAFSEGLSGG